MARAQMRVSSNAANLKTRMPQPNADRSSQTDQDLLKSLELGKDEACIYQKQKNNSD